MAQVEVPKLELAEPQDESKVQEHVQESKKEPQVPP